MRNVVNRNVGQATSARKRRKKSVLRLPVAQAPQTHMAMGSLTLATHLLGQVQEQETTWNPTMGPSTLYTHLLGQVLEKGNL